jgi:hypothetical protein
MGLTMAKKQTKARKVLQKPPILGWKTSDSDEIELRRWRIAVHEAGHFEEAAQTCGASEPPVWGSFLPQIALRHPH